MDWNAVKDLMDQSKRLKDKFPLGKTKLFIPIELMQRATDYAKEISLEITLKDLDDCDLCDKTTGGNK